MKLKLLDYYIFEYCVLILRNWKFIATSSFVISGVFTAYSYFVPEVYRSSATLLPYSISVPSDIQYTTNYYSSYLAVGLKVDTKEGLYSTIINSERLLSSVIYHYRYRTRTAPDSVSFFKAAEIRGKDSAETYELGMMFLQKNIKIVQNNQLAVLKVSMIAADPLFCQAIVNNILMGLDLFIRSQRSKKAKENLVWIQRLFNETKAQLRQLENELYDFMNRNRQISDSPSLMLERERLMRNVELQETLFRKMKEQYDLAEIESNNSSPAIVVLDYPRVPYEKESPIRRRIAMITFILGFLFSSMVVSVASVYAAVVERWLVFFHFHPILQFLHLGMKHPAFSDDPNN